MMKILLDTNVVSEMARQVPHPQVAAWYMAQPLAMLWLSAITVAELRAGVALLPEGRRRTSLHERLENELLPRFVGRVLPFDLGCTTFFAGIQGHARRVGRPVALADACIAAIALRNRLAVATRDASPFTTAGVRVVNPWSD